MRPDLLAPFGPEKVEPIAPDYSFFEGQKQTSQNSNTGNTNKANSLEPINEVPTETGAIKQEALESAFNTAMGLFTLENHGSDPQEDEFRRRMQKKKKRGFRL